MKKPSWALVVCLVVASASGGRLIQGVTVPDVEAAQKRAFDGLDRLQAMGAYVVGEDGEVLGKISRGLDHDALGNDYGAGSEYRVNGLFSTVSKYGSEVGIHSAFNPVAVEPPTILVKQGGTIYTVGLLTVSSTAPTKGQRINPYLLKAWAKQ